MSESLIPVAVAEERIVSKIYIIRGRKVMLDKNLAELYSVETRVLNQAVKRNAKRFPDDFMFQLTDKEMNDWKSQIVISNKEKMGLRKLPLAFTEQGVAMLSSVLHSETAIEVNIQIIRIFSKMRELLLTHKDILLKIEQLERKVVQNSEDIQLIFKALKELLHPPPKPRPRIRFRRQNEKLD